MTLCAHDDGGELARADAIGYRDSERQGAFTERLDISIAIGVPEVTLELIRSDDPVVVRSALVAISLAVKAKLQNLSTSFRAWEA